MSLAAARDRVPLRTQLVVSVVAVAALAVVLVAAAGALVLRDYLVGRVDAQLWRSLQPVTQGAGPMHHGMRDDNQDDWQPPAVYFGQVYGAQGQVVGTLGSTLPRDVEPPRLPSLALADLDDVAGEPFTVRSSDGDAWRVLVLPVTAGTTTTVASVAVGLPLEGLQETVRRLVLIDVVVAAVVLALLAAVARYVVRASLAPLGEVERTAEAIAAGDLSQRVPEHDPRTEVGRLGQAFNAMVARIEGAFAAQRASEQQARDSEERMRRFVADASHELRTPLTSIRGFAELYRQGAVPTAETETVMARIEDEASRMGVLVDDLLLLARLDEQRPLTMEPVDLLALAADTVEGARLLSPRHDVELVADAAPVVSGDPQRLRQVLTNLVGNAVRHTPDGTHVAVAVRVEAASTTATVQDWAVLEVRDEGPGLEPDQAEQVFERFYRADSSRTRADTDGGSGLGLAIVRALVLAHNGTVGVTSVAGKGTTFTVRLPLTP